MTNPEFSNAFTVLLNSYSSQASFGEEASKGDIVLNEYEKSLYLTKAQEEVVTNLYNGKNPYGDSFESTEEMRRYLDALVSTKVYSPTDAVESDNKVSPNSVFYELPGDLAFITMEQVKFGDDSLGCFNGSFANVYPVTQDEYGRVKNNPFRGPTRYKVLRLDAGGKLVELVSKYKIEEYLVRYLKKPTPIILENLPEGITIEGESEYTECALDSTLHNTILERAVLIALRSKGISVNK